MSDGLARWCACGRLGRGRRAIGLPTGERRCASGMRTARWALSRGLMSLAGRLAEGLFGWRLRPPRGCGLMGVAAS